MPRIECTPVESCALHLGMKEETRLQKKIARAQRRLQALKAERENNARVVGTVIVAHGLVPPQKMPELVFDEKGVAVLSWQDPKPEPEKAPEATAPEHAPDLKVLEGATS